jgi:predicted RNase H-like HicB family nuclease
MKYRIALHKSEEGYSVSVPGLTGCWSQGVTEQEALENIREAANTCPSSMSNCVAKTFVKSK